MKAAVSGPESEDANRMFMSGSLNDMGIPPGTIFSLEKIGLSK